MAEKKKTTVLIILDGWGIAPASAYNAITLAQTPNWNRLREIYPATELGATGQDVGLEDNKMSGSEAGHMNIGAGRIVPQDSFYISESIKDGSFSRNPAILGAIEHAKKNRSRLHLMGLMGDCDSPHSDPEHFQAILKLAKEHNLPEVFCHFFTDGRDSYPKSAYKHLKNFKNIMTEEGIGKVATISGRFYAMDRVKNWKRLARAFDAMVFSRGEKVNSAEEAIGNAYKKNLSDEYILPTVILEKGVPVASIKENDAVIFFNLRSDRGRQLSKLFMVNSRERVIKDDMPVVDKIKNLFFVALTDFGIDLDVNTAFPKHNVMATLPMVLEKKKQIYIAESEKFAHITYFFNGGYMHKVADEECFKIDSPETDSYDKIPEMSAEAITQKALDCLRSDTYDFIALNFANADMIGHTGNLEATKKAVEILDEKIGRIVQEVLSAGGNLFITADHGNAEKMRDEEVGQLYTFHTKNPVPFLIVGEKFKSRKLKAGGVLGNIAPTILEVMEIEKPYLMDKESLLI
ncbi:2,3-bisphosphoglycerate-independent phosphoglycerate mutase [Patescibacteria group bacterium]|nr:2,3-bisphosphoglycerate-independent phosphoglycerate mutase [Patescibacteria group bacterium]